MTERWVVNASPIIVLAKVAHQHLLLQLPDQFVIPEAVIAEIHDGPEDDPARLFLYDHTKPVVAMPTPRPDAPAARRPWWATTVTRPEPVGYQRLMQSPYSQMRTLPFG